MTNQVIDEEICISASLNTVWDALTNPDVTEKYWAGMRIESEWTKGAAIYYRLNGEVMDQHELREIIPQRLIEHTFKPMFGEFKHEPASLVSILLKAEGHATRITVLHRNFAPESKVYQACSKGWPEILKSLKTLLESNGSD
jgi:uncharacterized protein YndB with AHSA1/START domain